MSFFGVIFQFVLIQNVLFSRLLGIPEPEQTSGSRFSWLGLAILACVSLLGSLGAWALGVFARFLAIPSLFLPLFCIFFFALIYLLEILCRKGKGKISQALVFEIRRVENSGIAFGIAILLSQSRLGLITSALASLAAVLGYLAANLMHRKIMERLALSPLPQAFRGSPIILINLGLISMAFMAFDRLFLRNLIG